jgi:hypothetical protein
VHFIDASTIYIVGNSGGVYKTTNGGSNWSLVGGESPFFSNNLNGVHFTDALTGYIVGNSGGVYKTTNGGAYWSLVGGESPFFSNNLNGVHFINSVTDVIEFSEENILSIYPNPAQGVINVKSDNQHIDEGYTISDYTGRVVSTGKINSQITIIELKDLSGGIYVFSYGENVKRTIRLIKQ